MTKPVVLLLVSSLFLACSRPSTEVLRRQPAPALALELSLPDSPDAKAMRQAYTSAFREHFAGGLLPDAHQADTTDIKFILLVGQRSVHSEMEAKTNAGVDMAVAVASVSPQRVILNAVGPKSDYETAVAMLGYRPPLITGQVVLIRAGKDGFQESVNLQPSRILRHMRRLAEADRNTDGLLVEESRAVALEALAVLKDKFGWVPPGS